MKRFLPLLLVALFALSLPCLFALAESAPAEYVGDWVGSVPENDIELEFTVTEDGTGTYTFRQRGYIETYAFTLFLDENTFDIAIPRNNTLGISTCGGTYSFADGALTLNVETRFTVGGSFNYTVVCTKLNPTQTVLPQTLADVPAALESAATFDNQLALLSDAAETFADELSSGAWDVSLGATLASGAPAYVVPREWSNVIFESGEGMPEALKDARFIVLWQDETTDEIGLYGSFMARLPRKNIAPSAAEADCVLWVRQHLVNSQYRYTVPTVSYHRDYDFIACPVGSDACYLIDTYRSSAKTSGNIGALNGECVDAQTLYRALLPAFYGQVELTLEDGTALSFQQTGDKTCTLKKVTGNPVRLEIPQSVEGLSVTAVGAAACSGLDALEAVTVPEGVETLEKQAFSRCALLYDVRLPSTLRTVEGEAFRYCAALPRLAFPAGLESIAADALNMCRNLRQLGLPTALKGSVSLSDAPLVTVYDAAEDMPPLTAGNENGFLYAALEGEAVLLGTTGSGSVAVPASLGGYPVREIGANAFDANMKRFVSVALPEGVRTLDAFWVVNLQMLAAENPLRVFLPASVTELGAIDFPENLAVYAPEGGPALEWAKKSAGQAVACENAAEFSAPKTLEELRALLRLADTPDEQLSLIALAKRDFANELERLGTFDALLCDADETLAALLPDDWDAVDAAVADALPLSLRNKKTLILYDDCGALYLAGDFMAALPDGCIPRSVDEAECIVVAREYKARSNYNYMPPATSYHRYCNVYAFAPGDTTYTRICQLVHYAKSSGPINALNGNNILCDEVWYQMKPLLVDVSSKLPSAAKPFDFDVWKLRATLFTNEGGALSGLPVPAEGTLALVRFEDAGGERVTGDTVFAAEQLGFFLVAPGGAQAELTPLDESYGVAEEDGAFELYAYLEGGTPLDALTLRVNGTDYSLADVPRQEGVQPVAAVERMENARDRMNSLRNRRETGR